MNNRFNTQNKSYWENDKLIILCEVYKLELFNK